MRIRRIMAGIANVLTNDRVCNRLPKNVLYLYFQENFYIYKMATIFDGMKNVKDL